MTSKASYVQAFEVDSAFLQYSGIRSLGQNRRPEVLESGSNASFFLVWEMIRWLIVIASRVVCKNRWS